MVWRRRLKRRILGWVLVVVGMAVLITGAVREGGVNLFWGFVAMIGAGLVGPWPWFSKPEIHQTHGTADDESRA
jgi:hypothetical protein